ncbi:TPA: hypothetical protein ACG1QB_004206 [Enterobacter asburiae]
MYLATTLILLASAFILRLRFKSSLPLFLFLRKPQVSLVIITPLILINSFAVFQHVHPYDNLSLLYFITSLIIVPAWAIHLAFVNLSNGETGLLLTTFKRLRLDIEPCYIPENLSKEEYTKTLTKFFDNLTELQKLPFREIYFSSHLISLKTKRRLKKNLRRRGISFDCKYHKTCYLEAAVLNLRYGGRTRYRIFSHKLHANGFRVRRSGYTFIIKKKMTTGDGSPGPEE